MREILFRGKTPIVNRWVSGTGLLYDGINTWIVDNPSRKPLAFGEKHFTVIPETVGQYTGLTDKYGKQIFEGDILKGMGSLLEVYFDTPFACFDWKIISGNIVESFSGFADEYEVIGNIHDNPELIGGDIE